MKKIITLALASAAFLAAEAADVTVYNNGALNPGITVYGWWNSAADFAAADPTGSDVKVYSFKAADGGTGGSMGLFSDGKTIVTGPLHSSTLNFKWYATGTGVYNIRLTAEGGKEEDYVITVTAENTGKWNTEALNVSETFPVVAAQWADYVGKGAGYLFSVVLSDGSEGAEIYFDNIYYSNIDEAWQAPAGPEIVPPTTVPAIEQPKDDVLSVFSPYGNMAYNIGGWGQSTRCENITIDGTEVVKLTSFNYLGWEFPTHFSIEGYDYMHVDFYTSEETAFGFTPISPGQEKGWVAPEVKINEWNRYDAPISHFDNVNLADIFQIKFDQGKKVEGYIANVYFYKKSNGGDEPGPDVPGTGATYTDQITGSHTQNMGDGDKEYPYTLKYSITYNEDKTLTVNGTFDWTAGEPIGMVAGSVIVNNVFSDLTLENGVRTATTTDTYEAGAKIPVRFYIPVAMGVVEAALPDYTVGSEKSGGDDPDPEPDPEPVSGATYSGKVNGTESVEVEGETREYPYSCNYTITYNDDKTLTIKATFDWTNGEVPGLIPGSVFINNVLNDFTMTDGVRTLTTTDTYNAGEHLNLNFYLPRMLGVLQFPVEYVVGADNSTSGIADVKAPALKAGYYDLRGARVANPANGLFIRVENGKATKVYLK